MKIVKYLAFLVLLTIIISLFIYETVSISKQRAFNYEAPPVQVVTTEDPRVRNLIAVQDDVNDKANLFVNQLDGLKNLVDSLLGNPNAKSKPETIEGLIDSASKLRQANMDALLEVHKSIEHVDVLLRDLKTSPDAYMSVSEFFKKRAQGYSATDHKLYNLGIAQVLEEAAGNVPSQIQTLTKFRDDVAPMLDELRNTEMATSDFITSLKIFQGMRAVDVDAQLGNQLVHYTIQLNLLRRKIDGFKSVAEKTFMTNKQRDALRREEQRKKAEENNRASAERSAQLLKEQAERSDKEISEANTRDKEVEAYHRNREAQEENQRKLEEEKSRLADKERLERTKRLDEQRRKEERENEEYLKRPAPIKGDPFAGGTSASGGITGKSWNSPRN